MNKQKVTLELPRDIYDSLYQISRSSGWSFDDVILRTMRNGMPPSLKKVPEYLHSILLALNEEGDNELWDILSGRADAPAAPSDEINDEDFTAMWRAYAFSLLKWRGHPIPDPHEFIR